MKAITFIFGVCLVLGVPAALGQEQEKKPKYLPCTNGPGWLREIDLMEKQGISIQGASGLSVTAESIAEAFISHCANQLYELNVAIIGIENADWRRFIFAWQSNLDYMKWWLQNYRDKNQAIKPKPHP